ncbi:hypothetical protein YC2023_114586 [Brassica napus]
MRGAYPPFDVLSLPTKLRRVTALSPVSGGASARVPAPEKPLSLPSFSPLLLLCLSLPSDMFAVLGLVCGSGECSVRKERLSLAPHTFSGAAVRRTQGSVERWWVPWSSPASARSIPPACYQVSFGGLLHRKRARGCDTQE